MFETEFLDVPPLQEAAGRVELPGSKSISNRVLLLSALSQGTTLIHDLLDSDDTRVMLEALQILGCTVERQAGSARITGIGGQLPVTAARLFLGNAGTAMRPLTAALAVLGGDFELSGVARMHERPIGDLVDALQSLGCDVRYLQNSGYPPLKIGTPCLNLSSPIRVRGDVSSQFLTAMLMAMPLVSAQDVVIEVTGELISKPYIEITLQMMARYGVQVRRQGWTRFVIPAGSQYVSPGEVWVEADASSASYFVALGAIAATQGTVVRLEGVGQQSIQGDIRFVEAAQAMGAQVVQGPNWLEVSRGAWPLIGIDLDCNHIPDAAMTLAVMALYADRPSTLRNIASWRVKETDRIAAMATELRKLGACVEEGTDFIRIHPLGAGHWRAASIHTYDDHRVAMCFSLAAFNPDGLPVRIQDPKCVGKTFPDYFEALFKASVARQAAIPVICIDGPTASGKGTLAANVAHRLGYHYLDSGALYRLVGVAAGRAGLRLDDEPGLSAMAAELPIRFEADRVFLGDDDVSDDIRTEAAGMAASQVSAWPGVRRALGELQLGFCRLPGLVADGRDMGTVIFPNAALKVFLTASAGTRAERRYKQLISKGISANIDSLRADLEARDARDSSRSTAPLKAAQDALLLDNSQLGIEESVQQVLGWWAQRMPFKA
jgi:3-phosphoshikimate 1-carboxyvinyltransferase